MSALLVDQPETSRCYGEFVRATTDKSLQGLGRRFDEDGYLFFPQALSLAHCSALLTDILGVFPSSTGNTFIPTGRMMTLSTTGATIPRCMAWAELAAEPAAAVLRGKADEPAVFEGHAAMNYNRLVIGIRYHS